MRRILFVLVAVIALGGEGRLHGPRIWTGQ